MPERPTRAAADRAAAAVTGHPGRTGSGIALAPVYRPEDPAAFDYARDPGDPGCFPFTRGTYVFPPRPSLGLATDLFAWGAVQLPRFHTVSVSGYHIREAGATAAQELAFTFANGIAYLEAARERGLAIEAFAPQVSFFFN